MWVHVIKFRLPLAGYFRGGNCHLKRPVIHPSDLVIMHRA